MTGLAKATDTHDVRYELLVNENLKLHEAIFIAPPAYAATPAIQV